MSVQQPGPGNNAGAAGSSAAAAPESASATAAASQLVLTAPTPRLPPLPHTAPAQEASPSTGFALPLLPEPIRLAEPGEPLRRQVAALLALDDESRRRAFVPPKVGWCGLAGQAVGGGTVHDDPRGPRLN